MLLAVERDEPTGIFSGALRSPFVILLLTIAVLPLFLLVRLTIPIGPMY